jgi:TPR repeat protein
LYAESDAPRAARYRARACALSSEGDCPPHGPIEDMTHTITADAAACKASDGRACLRLAEIYATGDGAAENDGRARELFGRADTLLGRACERGDGEACKLRSQIPSAFRP